MRQTTEDTPALEEPTICDDAGAQGDEAENHACAVDKVVPENEDLPGA